MLDTSFVSLIFYVYIICMVLYVYTYTFERRYERTNEARYNIYTTVRSNKIKLLPKVSHHHIYINTFEGNYKQGIYMYGKCSEVRYINTKVRTKVFITYVFWISIRLEHFYADNLYKMIS